VTALAGASRFGKLGALTIGLTISLLGVVAAAPMFARADSARQGDAVSGVPVAATLGSCQAITGGGGWRFPNTPLMPTALGCVSVPPPVRGRASLPARPAAPSPAVAALHPRAAESRAADPPTARPAASEPAGKPEPVEPARAESLPPVVAIKTPPPEPDAEEPVAEPEPRGEDRDRAGHRHGERDDDKTRDRDRDFLRDLLGGLFEPEGSDNS
jgi:hypothetical protein